jgi:hypothetical protein
MFIIFVTNLVPLYQMVKDSFSFKQTSIMKVFNFSHSRGIIIPLFYVGCVKNRLRTLKLETLMKHDQRWTTDYVKNGPYTGKVGALRAILIQFEKP